MELFSDQVIAGKYRLTERLARGGMGAVWKARHIDLDVDIALKFLRSDSDWDVQARERFKREARAAAQIRSPHVVHIYDFGMQDDLPYIAMELLEGEDLGVYLERRGRLPQGEAASIMRDACKGLRTAHESGVVHRDIKPSNLFLSIQGNEIVVKVLDFGIAKHHRGDAKETTGSAIFGSPAYMSPEQARGKAVDLRSDLWSLAAVLYRILTGVSPFQGVTAGDILVRVCTEDVPIASSVFERLGEKEDWFFQKALSRNPNARFQSDHEFLEVVSQLLGVEEGAPSSFLRGGGVGERKAGRETETAPLARTSGEIQGSFEESQSVTGSKKIERTTSPEALNSGFGEERRAGNRKETWSRWALLATVSGFVLWVTVRSPQTVQTAREPGVPQLNSKQFPNDVPSSDLPDGTDHAVPTEVSSESLAVPLPTVAKKDLVTPKSEASLRDKTSRRGTISSRFKQTQLKPPAEPAAREHQKREETDPIFGLPVPAD